MGVKRLKLEYRNHIPGVIGYCRAKFLQQVPFDFAFRLNDAAFYCVELTEKAIRSEGLKLSEPVRIGNWEHLGSYPLTALATPVVTKLFLTEAISMEQPVYVPGNDHEGVWSSSLLDTVYSAEPKSSELAAHADLARVNLRGDFDLIRRAQQLVSRRDRLQLFTCDSRLLVHAPRPKRSRSLAAAPGDVEL